MAQWNVIHNKYISLQYCFDGWISVGIHIDFKRRFTGANKIPYGPYIDIHFLWFILSLGYNPYYSLDGSDGSNDKNLHI